MRFNVVGIVGFALQMAVLRLLQYCAPRWVGVHPLLASAIAIEICLIHNFIWHRLYTWRERSEGRPWLWQCVRFHLSNGAISIAGGAVIVHLLIHNPHITLMVANVIAVLICAVANFFAGNDWVFRVRATRVLGSGEQQCYSGIRAKLFPDRCIDPRVNP